MKRMFSTILAILAVLALGAYPAMAEQNADAVTGATQQTGTSEAEDVHLMKAENETNILVAYFSCTGTTRPLAEFAANALAADLYEIVPETPYTQADLNYHDSTTRATREQRDSSARPLISGGGIDMEDYDIVVLGYPLWWGQAPKIINTFLESYDFSGKTIVPFCTSHSSGLGSSASNLHDLCSQDANWLGGRRFPGGTTEETMKNWLMDLELLAK